MIMIKKNDENMDVERDVSKIATRIKRKSLKNLVAITDIQLTILVCLSDSSYDSFRLIWTNCLIM